ncbi:Hypothetical predicted protein [Mytilus galloprovincialis]|uniref:SWIM-type domain-containing protein n=1 Tax=Mytilus galloprovincialis TaxID=29158 RepID=A0A8B6HNA5_MYTGA|nr:Hypothetical predicted protein [Mytilus galloprovincialis]
MMKLAENVVFLDATYKGLTAYGYSFYALVARDEQQGRGTPLSYCISSDDTGEVVKIFLRSLKTTAENHGFDFCPRFFLGMKYHFLGGYANSRVEDLLILLHGNVTMFYDYLDELEKIGRLKNMGGQREDKSKLTAENMLKAELDQTVQWTSSTECTVPSQTAFGTIYNVDIVNVVCNCPAATTRERRSEAMNVFNAEQYFYDRDNNQVEVLSRLGNVSVVNLTSFKCTCFANSHGIHCVCVMVAKMVVPSPDIESTSIDETRQQLKEDKETTDQAIKRKIEEINIYVNNKNFQTIDVKKKKTILQALTTALHICKTTNFSKTTRKRKQQPLFPSRKSKSSKTDHDYSVSRKCVLKKKTGALKLMMMAVSNLPTERKDPFVNHFNEKNNEILY